MTRHTLRTGPLLSLLLGAAPLALWAQEPQDRLHDSVFVQQHRIRTVTELWSDDEGFPRQLTEQQTTYYSPSGRWLRADYPHANDPAYETRGPFREEIQVEDTQGRTVAIEHRTDGELESVEHLIYGPQGKIIQSFLHHIGNDAWPESWMPLQTIRYDLRGNAVEGMRGSASIQGGRLTFPLRWQASYDHAGRCIATVDYEHLIYPRQIDSTYYNSRGQIIRQVRYQYQQGRLQSDFLEVQQYDAAGRPRMHLSGENSSSWRKILFLRYRPDGQPASSVAYSGHRLPVGPAPPYHSDTIQLARNFAQEHQLYRYNECGLLEEISHYKYSGDRPINEVYDLTWRHAWRYTYYP